MKFTTEKLPKSLIALDIELDNQQVEKGLDRAARKISQRANIPGFRKGKAPRFIVENYFGRQALLEEATDDLINNAFRQALEESKINPIGQPSLQSVEPDPFRFRVTVPVPPTVTLPDHRAIQPSLEVEPISDEDVEGAMARLRDKHAVLQELDEPRPAQAGDQLTVKIESFADGEPLEPRAEGEELKEQPLILEKGRLVDELFEGLVGAEVGSSHEIVAHMPEDHANEQIRDTDVTFQVEVLGIQARLLPAWDDLPTLEEFEGSLDELRAKTRAELETTARNLAERKVLDSYVEQLIEQTEYDLPDVMVQEQADDLLEEQLSGLSRYGITVDQYLEYRGQSREDAVSELLPQAEQRVKTALALQELIRREGLRVSGEELQAEIASFGAQYTDEERERVLELLNTQLAPSLANQVMDRKLRERLLAIAQGSAPTLEATTTDEVTADEATADDTTAEADAEAGTEVGSEAKSAE